MSESSKLTNSSTSNSIVIQLEDVGVRYRVPSERISHFKEYAIRWLQRRIKQRDFWALKNINLTIQEGEAFGLIGPNGAGKSTTLKLVARVFRPTTGRVVVKGLVAPLLEFGAGFHPELTGRENIYLNGAVMGFTRQEMKEKIEGIVDFADLGGFIDVPIRTYSSGMWARLGFAVATDVDANILIIDEVLSVGDEVFQRKSSKRLQEFRHKGVTSLMVSHNMETIIEMCTRAAWLDHGEIKALGGSEEVVNAYLQSQTV